MNEEQRLQRIKALEKRLDRQYRYYLTIRDDIKRGEYIERLDETAAELAELKKEMK